MLIAFVAVMLFVFGNPSHAIQAAYQTQLRDAADDRFVTVHGAKIHYIERGIGPVLILIHGLADDVSVWEASMGPLSQKYHVIALDQIGFGRSDKPLINYRVGTFVDFLEGFCKELKVERATLVGSSLGGWVAAAFALTHPDRVDRLVLVDAAGFSSLVESLGPRALSALKLATREDIRYLGPLTFYHKQFYEGDATIDAVFRQRASAGDGYTIKCFLESMMRSEDVLDNRLAALKRPTLIVWGREDKLIPLPFGKRFSKEIIGSRLIILEQCGHMPQVECGPEFNASLLKFLGGD